MIPEWGLLVPLDICTGALLGEFFCQRCLPECSFKCCSNSRQLSFRHSCWHLQQELVSVLVKGVRVSAVADSNICFYRASPNKGGHNLNVGACLLLGLLSEECLRRRYWKEEHRCLCWMALSGPYEGNQHEKLCFHWQTCWGLIEFINSGNC